MILWIRAVLCTLLLVSSFWAFQSTNSFLSEEAVEMGLNVSSPENNIDALNDSLFWEMSWFILFITQLNVHPNYSDIHVTKQYSVVLSQDSNGPPTLRV